MKLQPRYKPGDRIGGRYQVHKVLMGGMGEVYLCLDLETNYPYALKTFQQRYLTNTQLLRHAFEQEVATWVALEEHPNIVRCFWMQVLDNQPFMCLEWIAGEEGRGTDLRGWLRRGSLDLKLALEIAIDICRGLIHAQGKQPGLVHRDLKPENILMAQGGLAKITDFGLAQIAQATALDLDQASTTDSRHSLIGERVIAGTPAYMAPEQWRSEPLDERTDIYALGVILYEMVAGVSPFQVHLTPILPDSFQRWLRLMQSAHEQNPLPPLPGTLPATLSGLLRGCLAKAPDERPARLTDLLLYLMTIYQEEFAQLPQTRLDPGVFTVADYNNRGITYAALRQYEVALSDFTQALSLDPNLAKAYSNRGLAYNALKQYEAALSDFTQALSLDPNDAEAYSNRGLTFHNLRQYEAALSDFTQALSLDPNLAKTYSNRGFTYNALHQHKAALSDFTQAIALNPNDANAYSNRGDTYHNLRQYEAALSDFTQAIALDPNLAQAYSGRGDTYHDLRQYEAALNDLTQALFLDSNDTRAYYNRGNTYLVLEQYKAALSDYTQALSLDPNLVQAYANRGVAYLASQHGEAALNDFTQAIALDPNLVATYYNRGTIYADLQQYEAALSDFTQVIALDPNRDLGYLKIGILRYNQGEYLEALPYFEKAAQLGDAQSVQYAAKIRRMLGIEPSPQVNVAQQAFIAFQQATSADAMRQVVAHFPVLTQIDFIRIIQEVIGQQISLEDRPAFYQRLIWLRQIAEQHKQ